MLIITYQASLILYHSSQSSLEGSEAATYPLKVFIFPLTLNAIPLKFACLQEQFYIYSPVNVQLCIFIAFLRKERTHPKLISQAQEIEIFL